MTDSRPLVGWPVAARDTSASVARAEGVLLNDAEPFVPWIEMLPTLTTSRLYLRPFTLGDAPALQRLANDPLIGDTTATLPYPYGLHHAESWIAIHEDL